MFCDCKTEVTLQFSPAWSILTSLPGPQSSITCKILNTLGCGGCFGLSQNELGFPKGPCVSQPSSPDFPSLLCSLKKNKEGFPQGLHAMAELHPLKANTEKLKWSKISFKGEASSLIHSTQVFFRLGSKTQYYKLLENTQQ